MYNRAANMALTIFDLDNTLIAGDSDYLWGEFLVKKQIVDRVWHQERNDRFYRDYENGALNIKEWLEFQLKPLVDNKTEELFALRNEFITTTIKPLILTKALAEIKKHADNTILIITATNDFITRPIADLLGIKNLLATEFEFKGGKYTGKIIGAPTYQDGKVARLNLWLQDKNLDLGESFFYSDSHNDIPLLSLVTYPIAVDPDPKLRNYAKQHDWQIISLR